MAPVDQADGDALRLVDDVRIGQDQPTGVVDHARAEALIGADADDGWADRLGNRGNGAGRRGSRSARRGHLGPVGLGSHARHGHRLADDHADHEQGDASGGQRGCGASIQTRACAGRIAFFGIRHVGQRLLCGL